MEIEQREIFAQPETLHGFISRGRRETYISFNIQPVSTPLIKGTTQYDFQNGEYLYRDIFVTGEGNFAGQEVICRGNSPIWTMVYCGVVDQGGMSDFLHISGAKENIGISKDDIFNFLRKALYKNSEEVRFGFPGRRIYQEEKWSYSEIGKKDFRDSPGFSGDEHITYKKRLVYRLFYQGGFLPACWKNSQIILEGLFKPKQEV